jgi:NAD(P)-dependent dehydrogenase (short-subunit alcohol dehydrogenase family)
MKLLDGKVAIITGASSGIGKAAAKLFAANGASVVLVARREASLKIAVDEIQDQGGRALAIVGDVTEAGTHVEAVAAARAAFGGLHIAFNNAGSVGTIGPLAEIEPRQWSEVLAVNLTAAFLGTRAQVPAMIEQGGGSIVFTSSFVGNSVGLPGMGPYGAAKAGLMGLSEASRPIMPRPASAPTPSCRAARLPTWPAMTPSANGLPVSTR